MGESIKKKAFTASLWRFGEVAGRQLISLLVTTIVARLVMPAQYGIVAMIMVFISISDVFIDSGFSTALIRDINRTRRDCSTVFYFNIVISLICFCLIQLCAPAIAIFYKMPELERVTRVVALSVIISAFRSVQTTLLSAELNFKKITNANLVALVISGLVGIILAYKGFQVWALVVQTLLNSAISTALMWLRSSWYPTLEFSKESFKRYFAFGSSLLVSALIDSGYKNCYALVIGKVFNSANLAFYNRANNFANTSSGVPTSIIESVTFPALCKFQDDSEKLRNAYRRLIKVTAFVIFPLCLGLGGVAYPFINVLLTDRWIYAATLMQVLVFSMMWYPIHSLNLNLLKVCGKSGLFFRLEIIKKIVGVTILCITIPFGLKIMCYGQILSSVLCLFINTYYTGKLINVTFWIQMLDLLPILILSIVMFIIVDIICSIIGNGFISLLTGIIVGIIVYSIGAVIFRFPELKEIKNLRK